MILWTVVSHKSGNRLQGIVTITGDAFELWDVCITQTGVDSFNTFLHLVYNASSAWTQDKPILNIVFRVKNEFVLSYNCGFSTYFRDYGFKCADGSFRYD